MEVVERMDPVSQMEVAAVPAAVSEQMEVQAALMAVAVAVAMVESEVQVVAAAEVAAVTVLWEKVGMEVREVLEVSLQAEEVLPLLAVILNMAAEMADRGSVLSNICQTTPFRQRQTQSIPRTVLHSDDSIKEKLK